MQAILLHSPALPIIVAAVVAAPVVSGGVEIKLGKFRLRVRRPRRPRR
jgi:hypothetical protein